MSKALQHGFIHVFNITQNIYLGNNEDKFILDYKQGT